MSKAFEFAKEFVEEHPDATFYDVKAAAKKLRVKVLPIQFGRVVQMRRQEESRRTEIVSKLKGNVGNGNPYGRRLPEPSEDPAEADVQNTLSTLTTDALLAVTNGMREIESLMASFGITVRCELRRASSG